MNETKKKILTCSLQLFNERGISSISLRMIADKADISVGNLQYHFKKREDIVEALYFELVKKIDAIIFIPTNDLLKSFLDVSVAMIHIMYEYHFFLLDFVTITRKNKKIKQHYALLSKRREHEFLTVIEVFINNNVIRKEILKNEYKNLYKRTEVISNYWFSSVLIQDEVLSKQSIDEYVLLIKQSIYPYLTEVAKKQYASMFSF